MVENDKIGLSIVVGVPPNGWLISWKIPLERMRNENPYFWKPAKRRTRALVPFLELRYRAAYAVPLVMLPTVPYLHVVRSHPPLRSAASQATFRIGLKIN